MKKTFQHLEQLGIEYQFHDYKKSGVSLDTLNSWCNIYNWSNLINTKGMTWRKLSVEQRQVNNKEQAVELMLENTSLIRRPVIERDDGKIIIGFTPDFLHQFIA